MKSRRWIGMVMIGVLALAAAPLWAQEEAVSVENGGTALAEEESKELSFAGAPYPFAGPDTGAGFGFSMMYRDLFNKEGRDLVFSGSISQSEFQDYSIEWQEPYFLSEDGRLSLKLSYSIKPAVRFFPEGNDTEQHGTSCNYFWTSYLLEPTYIHRFPQGENGTIGMRLGFRLKYADPDNGDYEDDDGGSFARPIRTIYPALYRSDQFDQSWHIGPTITLYHDSRQDRFPLGGGREEVVWPIRGGYEEVSYVRIDEGLGSTFTYNHFTADVRRFFPVFNDDTVLALRVRAVISQGNIPFYEMPNFGSTSELRGYYGGRFRDKNTTQFQVELRQAIAPDFKLEILNGLIKAQYPSVFIFWDEGRVYDDYTNIMNNVLKEYHYSYGFGFRFIITPTIVVRIEYGFSDEQEAFYLSSGLPI